MAISRPQNPAVINAAFELTVMHDSLLSPPFISTVLRLDKGALSVNPPVAAHDEGGRISGSSLSESYKCGASVEREEFHDGSSTEYKALAEKLNIARVNADIAHHAEDENQPTTLQPTFFDVTLGILQWILIGTHITDRKFSRLQPRLTCYFNVGDSSHGCTFNF
jgi:hypothetical protein